MGTMQHRLQHSRDACRAEIPTREIHLGDGAQLLNHTAKYVLAVGSYVAEPCCVAR